MHPYNQNETDYNHFTEVMKPDRRVAMNKPSNKCAVQYNAEMVACKTTESGQAIIALMEYVQEHFLPMNPHSIDSDHLPSINRKMLWGIKFILPYERKLTMEDITQVACYQVEEKKKFHLRKWRAMSENANWSGDEIAKGDELFNAANWTCMFISPEVSKGVLDGKLLTWHEEPNKSRKVARFCIYPC